MITYTLQDVTEVIQNFKEWHENGDITNPVEFLIDEFAGRKETIDEFDERAFRAAIGPEHVYYQ